jgi:hypothetical protein
LLLFKGTFTSFLKDKKSKRSQKTLGIKVFLLFLLDERSGSKSKPRNNGSGSGRPKNMWIRWIRIRIRNTKIFYNYLLSQSKLKIPIWIQKKEEILRFLKRAGCPLRRVAGLFEVLKGRYLNGKYGIP